DVPTEWRGERHGRCRGWHQWNRRVASPDGRRGAQPRMDRGRSGSMTAGLLTGQGMPSREGDLSIEGHGMDPMPATARYGSVTRVFTVWVTPNLASSHLFLGTLAAATFIGLGFWTALAASVVGNLVGSVLVGL